MEFNAEEHQHVRYNPLKDEWVLVSPHRLKRPWQGQQEEIQKDDIPPFDPNNPLCPGVKRCSGIITPQYESTYVFPNDFPCLLETGPSPIENDDPLFKMGPAKGVCRVMCFHPLSNAILPTMDLEKVINIIERWISETNELGEKYTWIQIFENRGALMGCSNPHPHCQIWASDFLPNEPRIKDENLKKYMDKYKRPMLLDYALKESKNGLRTVCENDDWIVVVPFWAIWPFETMVLPKEQILRFTDVKEDKKQTLAKVIQQLVTKYDNLFKCNFPYSMGWHGAPTGQYNYSNMNHWTFHGMYLPPLLRSATVRKFMVGYEMLAQAQRDMTPERAAAMLRSQSDVHYTCSKED